METSSSQVTPTFPTPAFYQDYLTACHDQFIKQIPGEEKHFERNAFCSRTQHNILQEFKPRSFNPKSSPLATRAPHLRQQCHKHSNKLLKNNIMVYPFACHYSSIMILPCVYLLWVVYLEREKRGGLIKRGELFRTLRL